LIWPNTGSTTALDKVVDYTNQDNRRTFKVIHPFHPLRGGEFEIVNCAKAWGEDRVYYLNCSGQIDNMPTEWTDLNSPDPFVALSAGRACLRIAELQEMLRMIKNIRADH
jgi:hypothetical protein